MKKPIRKIVSIILFLSILTQIFQISVYAFDFNENKTAVQDKNTDLYSKMPKIVCEKVESRSEYSKEYLLEDGSFCSIISESPVHKRINGKWDDLAKSTEKVTSIEAALSNIQNSFNSEPYSREEIQRSEIIEESSSNLLFNWKNTTNIIGGRHSLSFGQYFAVKPESLQYYLSKNKLIVYADISATCTASAVSETYAYEVNSNWSSNDSSIPGYEGNNVITIKTVPVTQSSQTFSWEITDLYSRWDRGETANNGLVISNKSTNGSFIVFNPCLVVRYIDVDTNDVDFTYHSNDLNKAGTLYINDATTTFRVDQNLIGLKYANYDFNVTRSYNSTSDSPFDCTAGIGMKFNFESSIVLYNGYAEWEMLNGNKTIFVPSFPLITQGDYQLWNGIDNTANFVPELWIKTSEITGFTTSSSVVYSNMYVLAESLKYSFNSSGILTAIKENETGNDIFTLEYENGFLDKVISPDGCYLKFIYSYVEDIYAYSIDSISVMNSSDEPISQELSISFSSEVVNNYTEIIQSMQFGSGAECDFIYDETGRLISIIDESGNTCDIDFDQNSPSANHINGYSLFAENAQTSYDSIEINKENTYLRSFTYSDGTSDSIGYDEQFRVRVYKGADGEFKCLNYGEGNTFIASSDGSENEFIQNSGFEISELPNWNKSINNNELINISADYSRTGNSLMLTSGSDGPITLFVSQDIKEDGIKRVFEADKTYVFGGWVYTTNNILDSSNEIGISIEAVSVDENTILESISDSEYSEIGFIQFDNTIHNSWQFKLQGFKLEDDSVIRIKLKYNNQKNTVYFDDILLFESVYLESDSDLNGMVVSNPIEYTNDGHLVTGETLTWERENDDDIYMSTSYEYINGSDKWQSFTDINGNTTYYQYDSDGNASGKGHNTDLQGNITDVTSFEYDAESLLASTTQVIKNVETNNNVTLSAEYEKENTVENGNSITRVTVTHNGYSNVFEYNPYGTLIKTYAQSDNPLSSDDEYEMDYTYSGDKLSIIDYSNGYRVKYLDGINNLGNNIKTISCYNVVGETETLIKSYLYTYDEDNILNTVYDSKSGLTIRYMNQRLASYEIHDYELIYKKSSRLDGSVLEKYRQRNYTDTQNTTVDNVETSDTVIAPNSDGTNVYTSSTNVDKNTAYYSHNTYYHGTFDYEKESIHDYFDRLSSKTVDMNYQRANYPDNLSSKCEYEYIDLGNGKTGGLVSDYTQTIYKQNNNNNNPTITTYQTYNRKYEYDNKGNIIFVYEEIGNTVEPRQFYEYDNANQVITEINFEGQSCAHYTYNAGGNITAKIYYDFSDLSFNTANRQIVSLGQEIRRVSYQYDSVWKDRVVYYSDTGYTDDNEDDSVYQAISYDKMGNPLNYVGDKTLDLAHFEINMRSPYRIIRGTLEWNGNRLVAFETDLNRYEYNYDANGFRTSKITFNKTTSGNNTVYEKKSIIDYIWNNGILSGILFSNLNSSGQRINTQTAFMIYDQEGSPTGYLSLAGVPYLFRKDTNDSILSLVYTDGSDVCSLRYDAWGMPRVALYGNIIQQAIALTTILLCPSLYHGYLYDFETGMYFNQGRCYSSSWCRYISPESVEKLTDRSENPLDSNLYLFCNNNTVNTFDTVGSWSREYSGVEWDANGFDIKMNDMFASRSMCMVIANQIIKKYGTWSPLYGYSVFEMNSLRISSDLFAHYVGKNATAAINKVNACWGDGWILNNKKSEVIKIRKSDLNAPKYLKIWKAAPEIKAYAQKEGIFIAL